MHDINALSATVLHSAFRIHMKLGPGLIESVYETVLVRDLRRHDLRVERQKPVSFAFEGLWFDDACRVDLLVERALIVEVKSVSAITAMHEKQLLTYLRLLDCRLGLLLNFGAALMKDGIRRVAHRL